jgi:dihydroorotase
MKVTAEVCPQHLALTDEAIREHGANAKVNPPIRAEEDRQALIAGLCDGTIDVIATDHAPHADWEKQEGMLKAPFGVIALEAALPAVLAELVAPGRMSLMQVVEKMSVAPARLFGLNAGTLAEGAPADVVAFDPDVEYVFDEHRIYSKSKNSPFIGRKVRGKVELTIVGGRIVFRGGQVYGPDTGESR